VLEDCSFQKARRGALNGLQNVSMMERAPRLVAAALRRLGPDRAGALAMIIAPEMRVPVQVLLEAEHSVQPQGRRQQQREAAPPQQQAGAGPAAGPPGTGGAGGAPEAAAGSSSKASGQEAGAAAGPKVCAACGAAAADGVKLRVCSGCKSVHYCGPDCQKGDWKQHKGACRAAQGKG
jgi:hypothetical protein